jgi:hypothetical protein
MRATAGAAAAAASRAEVGAERRRIFLRGRVVARLIVLFKFACMVVAKQSIVQIEMKLIV